MLRRVYSLRCCPGCLVWSSEQQVIKDPRVPSGGVEKLRELSKQDLFDVLQIGFREDSYTELVANILQNRHEVAREFYRRTMGSEAPAGPVRCETRVTLKVGGFKNVPDLVVLFGKPVSVVWMIEAKIEAHEGRGQTDRYSSLQLQMGLRDALKLPPTVRFLDPAFLTLDKRTPNSSNWRPVDYRTLGEVLDPGGFESSWMREAACVLKDRLHHYYSLKDQVPDPGQSIQAYLGKAKLLVTQRDLFHWLLRDLVKWEEEIGLHCKEEVAWSPDALPLFHLRAADGSWLSQETFETCPSKCHDVLLELRLLRNDRDSSKDRIHLGLMYRTNPYKTQQQVSGLPSGDQDGFCRRREAMYEAVKKALRECGNASGWKATNYPAQVACCDRDFDLGGTIGELEHWVRTRCEVVTPIVSPCLADALSAS